MADRRPAVPIAMQRAVLIEAGHRCAIPTCRAETTEFAHIVPWSEVREHREENLIALCPNCHTRYDKGFIDRPSMLAYKAQLRATPAAHDAPPDRNLGLRVADPGRPTREITAEVHAFHVEEPIYWQLTTTSPISKVMIVGMSEGFYWEQPADDTFGALIRARQPTVRPGFPVTLEITFGEGVDGRSAIVAVDRLPLPAPPGPHAPPP